MQKKKVLSEKQVVALELALGGMTDGEIARQVGVSRQCMSRWRNQDVTFKQEMTERREKLREAHMQRMQGLVGQAIGVLEEALDGEDDKLRLRTAMFVLKLAGMEGALKEEKKPEQRMLEAIAVVTRELGINT